MDMTLIERLRSLKNNNTSGGKVMYNGVVNISDLGVRISTKDKTEIVDKVKFVIVKMNETFFKVRRLVQFMDTVQIDYEVFMNSLDDDERKLFGEYFGLKRKLSKNGIRLSKEDLMFVKDVLVFPAILSHDYKPYIVTVEGLVMDTLMNALLVNDKVDYKMAYDYTNDDTNVIVMTIQKDDSGKMLVVPTFVKTQVIYNTVQKNELHHLFTDMFNDYYNALIQFVNSTKRKTEENIEQIKKMIFQKIIHLKSKYSDENKDIVNEVLSQINTTSRKVTTSNKKASDEFDQSYQELLNSFKDEDSNKMDVLDFDSLLDDEEDNEEIPF